MNHYNKHFFYNGILCLFLLFFPALHAQASAVINSIYPVEVTEDAVVIDGVFQVDADSDLNYLPFFHRMKDGEPAYGYFLLWPEEEQSFAEADKVSLARYTLSGKNLLEDMNTRLREIQMQREGCEEEEFKTQVFYLIDGNTGIDLMIRLEPGNDEHWLFFQEGDTIYQLYGRMSTHRWNLFQRLLSEQSRLQIAGKPVWGDTVQLSAEMKRNGKHIFKLFCYQGSDYYFNENTDILSCETDEDGFSITILNRDYDDTEKEYMSTLSLQATDALPSYETEEEMLSYLQKKYPLMNNYSVYPTEFELVYEDKKDTIFDDVFRYIEAGGNRYGYYTRNGKTYGIKEERESGSYSMISSVRSNAGYDYSEIFSWEKYEDGSIKQSDLVKESYVLEKDIGVGELFVFHMEHDETQTRESEWGDSTYRVEVYKKGESEPFQVFHESSEVSDPLSFEDFNADGYQDLFILFYYGANGGSASHYLWSPSREQFVKASEELGYFGFYSVDPDTRRLYMHYHGSAISGTEITFQWSNETDCEKIKEFVHDTVWDTDMVKVSIAEYSGEKEKLLTDYTYTYEEYDSHGRLIWGSYYADFVWEKEIHHPVTGEKYILRYAQDSAYDENGERLPDSWEDELYIYRKDTSVLNCLTQQNAAPYMQILWQDQNHDGEKEVIIEYENGAQTVYTWEQLMQEFKEE